MPSPVGKITHNRWRECDQCHIILPESQLWERIHPVTKTLDYICAECNADVHPVRSVAPEDKEPPVDLWKSKHPLIRNVPREFSDIPDSGFGCSDYEFVDPLQPNSEVGDISVLPESVESTKSGFLEILNLETLKLRSSLEREHLEDLQVQQPKYEECK